MDRVSLYYYSVVNSSHQVVDFVCDLTFVLTFDIRVHMMINPGRDSLDTQQSHLCVRARRECVSNFTRLRNTRVHVDVVQRFSSAELLTLNFSTRCACTVHAAVDPAAQCYDVW